LARGVGGGFGEPLASGHMATGGKPSWKSVIEMTARTAAKKIDDMTVCLPARPLANTVVPPVPPNRSHSGLLDCFASP